MSGVPNLSVLRDSAQRLNEISDRAAATVQQLETFLNEECSVGIDVSVLVSKETEDLGQGFEAEELTYLEYHRVGGRYRIAVLVETRAPYGDDNTVTPWVECKRDVKIETVKKLPELLSELVKAINTRIAEAEHAVDSAAQLLKGMGK
jgi:hypothetical protein